MARWNIFHVWCSSPTASSTTAFTLSTPNHTFTSGEFGLTRIGESEHLPYKRSRRFIPVRVDYLCSSLVRCMRLASPAWATAFSHFSSPTARGRHTAQETSLISRSFPRANPSATWSHSDQTKAQESQAWGREDITGVYSVLAPGGILCNVLSMRCVSANQALERTATRSALTFCVAETFSLPATLAPGGRRSACSR